MFGGWRITPCFTQVLVQKVNDYSVVDWRTIEERVCYLNTNNGVKIHIDKYMKENRTAGMFEKMQLPIL